MDEFIIDATDLKEEVQNELCQFLNIMSVKELKSPIHIFTVLEDER